MRVRLETIGDLRMSLKFYNTYSTVTTILAGIAWLFAILQFAIGNIVQTIICGVASIIAIFAGLLLLILANQEKIKLQLRGL